MDNILTNGMQEISAEKQRPHFKLNTKLAIISSPMHRLDTKKIPTTNAICLLTTKLVGSSKKSSISP